MDGLSSVLPQEQIVDATIQYATWVWDQIDLYVYLFIGTVFGFYLLRGLIKTFVRG